MKMVKSFVGVTCLLSSVLLAAPLHAAEEAVFKLTSPDKEIAASEFTVTLKGEKIKDLYAYEAKFSFDPTKVEIVKAETKFKGFSVSPIVKDNEITIAHTKIGNVEGEKGDMDIATLTFKTKKVGASDLKLKSMKIVDHNLKDQVYSVSAGTAFTKIFGDLVGHWAKADVMDMFFKGVVDGMDDERFVPNANVTRAQFATLISKALKLQDSSGVNPFIDVKAGAWYEGTVKKAYAAGIINGVSDREFAPEKNITREEMTVMLMRAKAYSSGVKVEDLPVKASTIFNDEGLISAWAKGSVKYAIGASLMNGRTESTFAPKENATRAESAVVLKRLLSN